jgi:1-acyl-sn-glycerol-3-phosphate acyltransferase
MDTKRHESESAEGGAGVTGWLNLHPGLDSCSFVSIRGDFLRAVARLLWLAGEIVLGLARFAALIFVHREMPGRAARTRWLQTVCRRALRVFGVELHVAGPLPSHGLLVCNHLSYLDILVLGATAPCVFVSKCEVRRWPVFGWFASLAGTLFLRRGRRSDVGRMTREMRRALDEGALVVLFPEGTTTDGRAVAPFKSSLLEAIAGQAHPVSAAILEYTLADGDVAEEVCYWKDMTLLPHLFHLLGKRGLEARLRCSLLPPGAADRKALARQLHAEVVRLKQIPAGDA